MSDGDSAADDENSDMMSRATSSLRSCERKMLESEEEQQQQQQPQQQQLQKQKRRKSVPHIFHSSYSLLGIE